MKLITLLIPSLLFLVTGMAQEYKPDALVHPRVGERTITVGSPDSDIPGFSNRSIQYAIDALQGTGGTVQLSEGIFHIMAPIRCHSRITLRGSGDQTILKKAGGVQTSFVIDADYGELKITVADASGFMPGMKVQVTDDENSSCWNVSTAYITEIIDNTLYIGDHLIRDYHADHNGLVSNATSVVDVIGAEKVVISNLTIDGNKAENFRADGCNSAGILVFKSTDVTVDRVSVRDFNGEGISWQITENVTVRNSEITGSGNHGLHPGTGSPNTVIENNEVHGNALDGLFICWRVHHSRVANNRFYNNGRFGICTGHKDTDVLFSGNHIYDNGSDGVNLRGENERNAPHRNTFENNVIENNGRKDGGYGFSVNSPAVDLVLKENIIRDTDQGSQKPGIYIYKNGSAPRLIDNQMDKIKGSELVHEVK